MHSNRSWIVLAVSLLALGIVGFALEPALDPKPDTVCVADGKPSSGFVDDEKHCNVSDASYERIADWEAKPKLFRIAGVGLILAGIVVAVLGAVRGRKRSDAARRGGAT